MDWWDGTHLSWAPMFFFKIEKSPGIISKTPVTLCGDAKTWINSSCYQYSAKSASPLADSTFRTPFFCKIRMCSFQLLLVPASMYVASETPGNGLESVSAVASTCWFCRGHHIAPQHQWLAAAQQLVSPDPEYCMLVSSSCTCAHGHLPTRKHTHEHIIKLTNLYNTEQKTEKISQRSSGGGLTCGQEWATSL